MNSFKHTLHSGLVGSVVIFLSACSELNVESVAPIPETSQKPNIVFILVDDVGWNDVGYNGSEISTPNIDALAASGVRLERSYVFPICSPTRAALLTGQNPLKYGVDSPMALDGTLPLNLTLLPEHLKSAGYETWLVGKWHLGHKAEASRPNARGFDHSYGLLNGWVDHYTHVFNGGLDWQRNGVTVREEGHATALLTKEAISLLKNHNDENPFFLYMAYNAPHTPLQLIDGVAKTYPEIKDMDRRVYAEMMTDLDVHIGQLVGELETQGMLDSTLIVFMSDNGGDREGLGSDNTPLRGGKGRGFEGGLRTPALVSWQGKIEGNQALSQPVFIQNWAPTLLDVAGVDYTGAEFDGLSHWQLITGQREAASAEVVAMGMPQSRAVMSWPYKYVSHTPRFTTDTTTYLFNVEDDPNETTDIIANHPEVVASLVDYLTQYEGIESVREKGPRPEELFKHADGTYNYELRLPEEREPWIEEAKDN